LRTLKVTDFISGMTDSFAVSLYKQLTGISLPTG
jgi:dGTPase